MSACIFCAIDRHEVYDIPVFSESAFVSDRIIGSMVSTVVVVCDIYDIIVTDTDCITSIFRMV